MPAHLYDRAPVAGLALLVALGSTRPLAAQPVNAVPCSQTTWFLREFVQC